MIDEKQAIQKATRPASRWRNLYLTLRPHIEEDGRKFQSGQKSWGRDIWPSRDTAETFGQAWEARNPGLGKYLGAFPVNA